MTTLSNKQLAYLRSEAHHLNPTVMIGLQGLSDTVMAKINNELDAHELIKVKFLDFKDLKRELSASIAAQTGCTLVTIIGNIAVLYRENTDPARRKVVLPA
jgi:RNA-binding protein